LAFCRGASIKGKTRFFANVSIDYRAE